MVPMTAEMRWFVDIDATPERVWQVLTDVPAYPQWNPFITGIKGTSAVGGRMSVSLAHLNVLLRPTLRPRVLEVTRGRRLRFRLRLARLGTPGLLDTEHTLTITVHDDGRVRLWHQVHFRGLLVPVVTRSLNSENGPSFDAMNAALKERAESKLPTRSA
jgi:hypothetical protein